MEHAQCGNGCCQVWVHTHPHVHIYALIEHLEIILELPSHFLFILFIKGMLEESFCIERKRTKEKNISTFCFENLVIWVYAPFFKIKTVKKYDLVFQDKAKWSEISSFLISFQSNKETTELFSKK